MKILVLGLNYAPERIGIAVYTSGMAEALVGAGHEVAVVAGYPYYPAWRVFDTARVPWARQDVENGVSVMRVWHYVPADPGGMRRLLHHASFALTALFAMLWRALTGRPDMVIAVAPSLMAAPVAWLVARLVGARCWLHVQDFEVETAFATGLMRPGSALGRLGLRYERLVLRLFDRVSAISPKMCRKLVEKGVSPERVVGFRNWGEIARVTPGEAPSLYRQEWGVTTRHVALYSGNIGKKQGLEIVVEAARALAHRDDLTVVICGEGTNRARLEAQAAGLVHVQFHDLQPPERLDDLMGLATMHLLPQLAGVADLVLPSKLSNMLASGRPIVTAAAAGTGLWNEVSGCGVTVAPGDAAAFAAGMARLTDDAELAEQAGISARRRAEQRWSKAEILRAFMTALEAVEADPSVAGAWRADAW